MVFFGYAFIIFCFFKTFYYGLFELKTQNNKKAGIIFIFLSFLSLIFSAISLILSY